MLGLEADGLELDNQEKSGENASPVRVRAVNADEVGIVWACITKVFKDVGPLSTKLSGSTCGRISKPTIHTANNKMMANRKIC
jgi:hypothetical protein